MTLASEVVKISYNGDDATVSFPITFVFWDSSDIKAVLRDADDVETTWVEGTQYTITGGSGSTGTLTVDTSPTDYTPATGETLLIKSARPNTQGTAFPLGGPFPSTNAERAIDQNTRLIQQGVEELSRAVKFSETSPDSDVTFPDVTGNGSKLIRVNEAGTALEAAALGDLDGTALTIPLTVAQGGTNAITAAAARASLDVLENVFTTRGDLVRAGAAGVAERVALGTSGQTIVSDGTDAVWAAPAVPRSYLAGLGLANGTDADHDIDVAAGVCRDSANAVNILLSAITKQIDATWVAGTNAGGLSSSLTAPANATWYYVYAIIVGGVADVGFDTSKTAANLVADHAATAYRRLGAVKTDGSANIIAFKQNGDHVRWVTPVADINVLNPGTSAVTRTLASVPPIAGIVAEIVAGGQNGTSTSLVYGLMTALDETDSTPSATLRNFAYSGTNLLHGLGNIRVKVDGSGQVRSRQSVSATNDTFVIDTFGWYDRRGRDD